MSKLLSDWLVRMPSQGRPAYRLYCFPYAGGSGTVFLPWQQHVHPGIEIVGIQMPGRGALLREQPYTSLLQLTEVLAQVISASAATSVPFGFFGHSLGGIVSFELTRYCRRHGLPLPSILFVSGCDAPQHRDESKQLHLLDDEALTAALHDYDGTPPEVLGHRELMALALPAIRADFTLVANYVYQPSMPLEIPLTVLAGKSDPHVSQEDVVQWKKESRGPYEVHWFDGGHFFIDSQRDDVVACVNNTLRRLLRL